MLRTKAAMVMTTVQSLIFTMTPIACTILYVIHNDYILASIMDGDHRRQVEATTRISDAEDVVFL